MHTFTCFIYCDMKYNSLFIMPSRIVKGLPPHLFLKALVAKSSTQDKHSTGII